MPVPAIFLARMERLLGTDYPAFAASYAALPNAGLRVNTLKVSPEQFQIFSPFPLQPLPWTEVGFQIEKEYTSPGKHPYHAAGLYYLQEPSAMAVVEALDPLPGEKVLDLAAAPGGKTTHLAATMQGKGLLVANEVHHQRVWDLAENLERWGATNVVITNETPERMAQHFESYFDRVLLDAPCSGEGLFRKTPMATHEWSEALVQSCAFRQVGILQHAAQMVRPGGHLVYSTCTFSPQENEGVIARFIESSQAPGASRFELVSLAHIPGLDPGRPDWLEAYPGARDYHLEQTARIWQHRSLGEGHFIALMQRTDSHAEISARKSVQSTASPQLVQARKLYDAFCRATLLSDPYPENIELVGSYLYHTQVLTAHFRGLKVIHPGLWLGTVKKDRFEPSHALALALLTSQAQRTLSLNPSDPACVAYLKGEILPASLVEGADKGWTLVNLVVPDIGLFFPLGWGKRVGNQVKNAYPKGLRRINA